MSPATARDPFDDGNAPWTGSGAPAGAESSDEVTRPLPRPETAPGMSQGSGASAAPAPGIDDTVPLRERPAPPAEGRTGVASGRLHPRDLRTGAADPVRDDHLTEPQDRISAEASWDSMHPAVRPEGASAAPRPTVESLRARQRQRFGGMQMVSGLMGLLVAAALGVLLLAAADLIGPRVGLEITGGPGDSLSRAWGGAGTPQLWGGVAVLGAVELLSMLAGGYVAGRMARFSGVAQGVSVWLWSLLARAVASVAVLLGVLGTTAQGASRWIVQETVGADLGPGLVALAGIAVLGLLGAVLGGVWGMRYHRAVDTWTMSNAWK